MKLKKDDVVGLVGGLICLGLSEIDRGWGLFWFVAGVGLIAWSVVSIFRPKRKS
ncbi:MAG: hypothetical protein Tsb009_27710 [Planctomycetaceae bacterium]